MVQFRIATLYDEAYQKPGDLVSAVNADYADTNGYDFVCHRGKLNADLGATWSKLWLIHQELPTCQWLLWVDADALIVNKDFRLETLVRDVTPDKNLLLSADSCGYCMGVFLIRNTQWSVNFLRTLIFCGPLAQEMRDPKSPREMSAEQDTFKVLLKHFPWVSSRCAGIPDSIVQSPESVWNPEAFINHYWGNNLGPDYGVICRAVELYRRHGYTEEVKRPF